jgi:hypothetical protein
VVKSFLFTFPGLLLVVGAAYAQSQPQPDLVVDPKMLRENWIVHVEDFTSTQCDAVEGGISAGQHPVMRFSVSTPNIGDAPVAVVTPMCTLPPTTDCSSSRPASALPLQALRAVRTDRSSHRVLVALRQAWLLHGR